MSVATASGFWTLLNWWASSPHQSRQQHYDEDDQEDEKQYLRDTCRSDCDPTKTKEAGDYRDYQKHQRPIKHALLR